MNVAARVSRCRVTAMPLLASTRRLESLGLAASGARLSRAMQHPKRTQHRTLQAIVEWLADTESGRRHGLPAVASLAAFRDRVPPNTRDEFRFDVERTVSGEPDILVPGHAVGARATMSAPPRSMTLPVSVRCRGRARRDAAAAWAAGLVQRHPRVLGGDVLVLPPVRPPAMKRPSDGPALGRGLETGTRLGHLLDVLPAPLRRRLVVPPALARIAHGSVTGWLGDGARRRLVMRLGLSRDVRLVIGGDPAELSTCFASADEVAETIIRDVRDGTFTCAGSLPSEVREDLARRFPPDRDRARELERGRSVQDGRLVPVEAWSLEAVGCLAQGRAVTMRARLDPWLDPWRRGTGPCIVDLGLLTAEAAITHGAVVLPAQRATPDRAAAPPADADDPPEIDVLARPPARPWQIDDPVAGPVITGAGPPALESAFLEFVEEEAMAADPDRPEQWRFREVHELAIGVRYGVFVTTPGGLLRTETRDLVEVVGRAGHAPLLRSAGHSDGILAHVT